MKPAPGKTLGVARRRNDLCPGSAGENEILKLFREMMLKFGIPAAESPGPEAMAFGNDRGGIGTEIAPPPGWMGLPRARTLGPVRVITFVVPGGKVIESNVVNGTPGDGQVIVVVPVPSAKA